MSMPEYTALIRTFNSERTLPKTLSFLSDQAVPPARFVFVDSGSTDGTLARLPANSIVHRFVGEEFNYAESLNQGIQFVSTDYVLIISSHTSLSNPNAIEYALKLLATDDSYGAAYFCLENPSKLSHTTIDKQSFTGFNGLFNTCALVRVRLLRERGFRKEVFTSEDQEWAKWLLFIKGGRTARIAGGGLNYDNPRGQSIRKRLNEYIAVACFVNRSLLGIFNILHLAIIAIRPRVTSHIRFVDRIYYLRLSFELLKCRYSKPPRRAPYS